MPQVRPEGIAGFQLWINLPAKLKMTAPRYQDIASREIPEYSDPCGAKIRVIAGNVDGVTGPVSGIFAEPIYFDVFVSSNASFTQRLPEKNCAFAYVFEGAARFDDRATIIGAPRLVLWSEGERVAVSTAERPVRFLMVSGKPLNEPIARYGPFVMNTRAEIEQALADLDQGRFVT
jgi:redox-sensitive bicupin YhaK (pirin superfamily)